ncbi:MAG: hypothetical protein GAK45_00608 [Pseudomonas citronellolis]|nr:MAG: hypothetical protein GAK45_00608 [Pseudomonas citronellolis]
MITAPRPAAMAGRARPATIEQYSGTPGIRVVQPL